MSKELPANPDFKAIEKKWQDFWLKNKIYKFDKKSKKPVYSIDTPPPYISGRPHMGHAVSYTGFEFIARYKRMTGYNVFFPIGFDDNGHPTERYVEKKHNIKSSDLPREEFIKLCRKETELLEQQAKEDFTKLGHSYDWDFFYSTISPLAIKTAQKSFIDLYKKKLVYRAKEPGLWCIECKTALSQADIEDEKRKTLLNYIDFILEDGSKLNIATTRPELLPACVGIFVNPNDGRYSNLIGKKAKVPLFDYWVEIRADPKVDSEFGTGAVMICTFGDKTDIEWWKKYKLDLKICLTSEGKLNQLGKKYAGLNLKEAREAILGDLEGYGSLTKQEQIEQTIGACWRCHTAVEFLPTKQWLIKILKHKKELIKQAKKIKWIPNYYIKRYEDWVKNISWDWTISRQRHYGVPMPIWYCKKCGMERIADETQLPVDPIKDRPKSKCWCGSSEVIPEHDVFDTWMTSSMTPELALNWANNDKNFKKMFPEDLRPQGYEIIRTWAFYTILKAHYHFKKIPWKVAMVNGMVLGTDGRAMHKSWGNYIEPMEKVEQYGSDAMRYFASTVNIGENVPFQEKELVHARKLLTKLWNVARFIPPHINLKKFKSNNVLDRWIISRLSEIIKEYRASFENYNATNARRILENFFWHEFCDYYIEIIKHRLYGNDNKSKNSAQQTLSVAFLALLKMFAIFLSHITEEIYQSLFKGYDKAESIHLSSLPKPLLHDPIALKLGELTIDAISEIRKYKQGKNMSLGAELEKLTLASPKAKELEKVRDEIAGTMRIKKLEIKLGKQLAIL